jgi:photosystem II stability/assembly factor-like uncharacterized protein
MRDSRHARYFADLGVRSTKFLLLSLLLGLLLLGQSPTGGSTKPAATRKTQRAKKPAASKKTPAVSGAAPATVPKHEERREAEDDDPDLPAILRGKMDKQMYLELRAQHIARLRGIDPKNPPDPQIRMNAIRDMEQQEQAIYGNQIGTNQPGHTTVSPLSPPSSTTWTPVGPAPIPNGQTSPVEVPVSGRVTAIAVDPRNADVVYVGAAQGGVYRSLDGGNTWTPLMDNAQSLAIGAVTIDPLNPSTVFVGTGEGNLSIDSFFGIGLYRIDNADTSPILSGPFETRVVGTGTGASNGHAFRGTSITRIIVDPTNDNRILIGNTIGGSGLDGFVNCCGGNDFNPSGFIGLYFSGNALSSNPQFSRVGGVPGGGAGAVTDVVFEPGSNNNMLVAVEDFLSGSPNSGIYRTTVASQASFGAGPSPAFTETLNLAGKRLNVKLAINNINQTVTALAGTQENGGTLYESRDGGASWPSTVSAAAGFCDGQCFYDLAVTLKPDDANTFFLGGAARGTTLQMTTDGGGSFGTPNATLHADTHAIVYAPSNYNVMYAGNDGGIWRSDDGGNTWSSRNTATFSATQFQSLALHPLDRNFMIGGTQDNGTPLMHADGSWFRSDFGDGGYSLIDQNATDTTNVTMYHTYFNVPNVVVGYAYVTGINNATEGNWNFSGCSDGVTPANGITCDDRVSFYPPMALGPGNPNTVYFGTDRLYRSTDGGKTNTVVSQAPIATDPTTGLAVPISAIAISPLDDNVRLVGLANGQVFFTTNGSSVLQNTDRFNTLPHAYVSRLFIDRHTQIAYVTLDDYGVSQHVMNLDDLNNPNAGWSSLSIGIPNVPVNCLVVDPFDARSLYAGTDIGVFHSSDGFTWSPFGLGLPRVAVFDLAIQHPNRVLRAATHGRGIWEIGIPPTTDHFSLLPLIGPPITTGSPLTVIVFAQANGYTGTIHFTSTDPKAVLPADYTFLPNTDRGQHSFNIVFRTVGTQTITVADTFFTTITGTTQPLNVLPGPTDHFKIDLSAASTIAGNPVNVTVTAQDAFNNSATTYSGTVHFTSSDRQAGLPSDGTLTNGVGTFPVTLKTAGPQFITATDTVAASMTGTSSAVIVAPAAANYFLWNVPLTATVGQNFSTTLTAFDSFNNLATTYTGTVQLSTTGTPTVTAPGPYTFTSGAGNSDNGIHNFANGFQVTSATPGDTFTITANDVGNAITATSAAISATNDAPLTGLGRRISMFRPYAPVLIASFIDADSNENGSHLSASIDWGDGTTTLGTVARVASTNVFNVMGSHEYARKKVYVVTVTMTDDNSGAGHGSAALAISTMRLFPMNGSH